MGTITVIPDAKNMERRAREASERFEALMSHLGTSMVGDCIRPIDDLVVAKEIIWKFTEELERRDELGCHSYAEIDDINSSKVSEEVANE